MAQELTLEQELTARIFLHKVAIAGGVLTREYMQENYTESEVNLPEPILLEFADTYSNDIIQKSLVDGTFDSLYDTAWNSIKETMPEHTKVM